MDYDNDPFPRSLPHVDEPRIFDSNMADTSGDNGIDFSSNLFDSPSYNPYSPEQNPYAWEGASLQTATKSAMTGPSFSHSPESSLPDSSSSDSSNNQRKRNHSSASSGSGALGAMGDIHMRDDTVDPRGIIIGADPVEDPMQGQPSLVTDLDSSNRAMEYHFDFDSAASSPTPRSETKPTYKSLSSMRSAKVPDRPTQGPVSTPGVGPYARNLKTSRETSPLSTMLMNQSHWSGADYVSPSSQDVSDQFINGSLLNKPSSVPDWSHNAMPGDLSSVSMDQSSISPQPAMNTPYASPTSVQDPPDRRPYLDIYSLPEKSRVETQIQVTMRLYPMPPGITKLHLQTYTISKSKLVAKPPPEKSPDTLELYAMLVSTTAMWDPMKRERAADKAIKYEPQEAPREDRRSPSGDTTQSEDDDIKPLNGGPVQICKGCIERERKRAGRKKTKNKEEEEEWLKDEAKRTIVFNCPEIKDWQQPSLPKDGESIQPLRLDSNNLQIPRDAHQVILPMRIACYCRHQEEKNGFQVIFTIKDYLGKVVAQNMTTSIVITDDHKTHPLPGTITSQNMNLPEHFQVPGAGVFPQAPPTHAPASFRNAYSTTDLQGLQRSFNAQQISPYAIPQNQSQATSATLTPNNLSRQASPSAPSGQNKRRKASGSGRIRNDLTMTKLEATAPPQAHNQHGPAFAPSYITPPQPLPMPSMSSQYGTNPSTPNSNDGTFFPTHAQRSQSMENLQNYPVFSTQTSGRPSRVPSPTTAAHHSGIPQAHAQLLTNSLRSVPGAIQPQRTPRIHELTPAESSKSGGIKVACFGSGFYPGLVVMFGEAQAITTTFWGETALQCLVPPAVQAGTVAVTFMHDYEHIHRSPPNMQVLFRYVDDEEQQLKDHALALVNQKLNGNATSASESAQNIIKRFAPSSSSRSGSNQGSGQQRQASNYSSVLAGVANLEAELLECLDFVDLDDSPYQASFNSQSNSGQSMLHLSASLGYYRLTAGLLARGAHPDLRDNNGMSAMHMASLRGHTHIIRKLRSAGGDPTLRSLNGYTPADMATSQQVLNATDAFDHHVRSRSTGTTPISTMSRDSSVMSYSSTRNGHSRIVSAGAGSGYFDNVPNDIFQSRAHKSQPVTPNEVWARSRRNSLTREQYLNDEAQGGLAPNAFLFAWRDQISAQIHQLQQSVHRTLPNLQIPALPPIPNLPDYQANPVVRRISSLVPQRNPAPLSTNGNATASKEADYHWWELLTGAASSPPAYEEIYPENAEHDMQDKKRSALLAAGEALVEQKCVDAFDQAESSSVMDAVNIGSKSLTRAQRERLRIAHANKVKKLRSDRNLFFVWIPLLILVLVMMLKDRLPQALHAIGHAFSYVQERFQDRVIEVV
ncbi:hypothetical protein P7C71_g146, partial [Lecanoromycetidae sp. Uapishka_2]